MGHHIVGGEQPFFRKENDSPMQPGPAFEQILPQSSDSQASMQMGTPEAAGQRPQGFRNLLPFRGAQSFRPLPQAGMEVDPHRRPVNGLVRLDALALRTAAFTDL